MNTQLPLNEAAQILGVSKDTVRRWEKKGLLKSERTAGGHRRFNIHEIEFAKNRKKIAIPANEPIKIIREVDLDVFTSRRSLTKKLLSFVAVSYTLLFIASNSNFVVSKLKTVKGEVLGVQSTGGSAVTIASLLDNDFNFAVRGFLQGDILKSTSTTSAPLNVANSIKVQNLNSDFLDGKDWSDLPDLITSTSGDFTVTGKLTIGNISKINGVSLTFPSSQGGSNSLLTNDGSGNLSWGTLGAGGISADSLDYTEFKDSMALDANLTLSQNDLTWAQTFTGTVGPGLTYTSSGAVASGNAAAYDVQVTNASTSVPAFMISNAGSGSSLRVNDDGTTADSTPFVVNANGYVGIGTADPATKLDIPETGTATEYAYFGSLGHGFQLSSVPNINNFGRGISGTLADLTLFNWNGPLRFLTGDAAPLSERMRILATGEMGIGLTVPITKFEVQGAETGKALSIFDETGDQDVFTASTSGTTRFRIAHTGGTFLDLPGTGTANALCHTTQTGVDNEEIVDCTSAPIADYAEQYPVESGITYGNVVAVGTQDVVTTTGQTIKKLVKTTGTYQQNVVGIVSNNHNDFTSAGYNINSSDNPMPIALNGRVPVKVSPTSEAIQPGDFVTTSNDPGMAMKATTSGYVIGKALSSWNHDSDTVMIFVDNTYSINSSLNNLVGNDNIRGSETVHTGDTQIQITKTWTNPPVSITANATWDSYVWVDGITKDGFTIHMKNTPTADSQVFWNAIW